MSGVAPQSDGTPRRPLARPRLDARAVRVADRTGPADRLSAVETREVVRRKSRARGGGAARAVGAPDSVASTDGVPRRGGASTGALAGPGHRLGDLPGRPRRRRHPRRVWYHLKDHGADPTFQLEGAQWVARIPRPPVARMEYLLIVEWPDGTESMVTDPANPRRVRSVFGDKSVIEFPGYARPWWLSVADAADAQARRADAERAAAERGGAGIGRMRPRGPASARTGASRLVAVPTPSTFAEDADPTQMFGEGVASVRMRPRYRGGDDRRRRAPAIRSHPVAALVADQRTAQVVDADADVAVTGQLHVPADSTPSRAVAAAGGARRARVRGPRAAAALCDHPRAHRTRSALPGAAPGSDRPRPQLLRLTRRTPVPWSPGCCPG